MKDHVISEQSLKRLLIIAHREGSMDSVRLPKLKSGESYAVQNDTKSRYTKISPYETTYGGRYMNDPSQSMIQIIGKMTAAERWFFLYLHERIDYETNIAEIVGKDLTGTQRGYLTKAFKTLNQQDLIKRVKREHYMFNPYKTIIPIQNFEQVTKHWDSL